MGMKLGHFPMHGKLPMRVFTLTHFRRWSNNLHPVLYVAVEMMWRFRISGNAEAINRFRSILQIIHGRIYETSFREFISCRNTQPTRFDNCQKRLCIMVTAQTSWEVTMVPQYLIVPLIRIIRPSRTYCFHNVFCRCCNHYNTNLPLHMNGTLEDFCASRLLSPKPVLISLVTVMI